MDWCPESGQSGDHRFVAADRLAIWRSIIAETLATWHTIHEALQEPVVISLPSYSLDRFWLDATKDAGRPIGDGEASATDTVNRVTTAVIKTEIRAAVGTTPTSGAITIEAR